MGRKLKSRSVLQPTMRLLLALGAIIACCNVVHNTGDLPEFKKYKCADYELVEKKENYEIRRYPAYKMATAFSHGLKYNEARDKNFYKLLRYIRGKNEKHMHIPLMIPILTIVNKRTWANEMNESPVTDDNYGVAYFLPRTLVDPPKGTIKEDAIRIVDIGPITAYAVRFPGFLNETHVNTIQQKL